MASSLLVVPGLGPGIHVLATSKEDVDGRVREAALRGLPGHDEPSVRGACATTPSSLALWPLDCFARARNDVGSLFGGPLTLVLRRDITTTSARLWIPALAHARALE
jgi:hypothetical protein